MAHGISSGQTTQLTDNDTKDMRPCTAGGKIYWQGEPGADVNYQLFVAQRSPSPSERPFVDVPSGHYYVEAIEGLYFAAIVDGRRIVDGKRYYDPDEPVNRAQFAKMVTGTLGVTIEPPGGAALFVDLGDPDANGYPHKYVATILKHKVTRDIDGNALRSLAFDKAGPGGDDASSGGDQPASRPPPGLPAGYTGSVPGYGSPDHAQNLRIAEFNGLLDHPQGFGPGWDPEAPATRAECTQCMWNYLQLVGFSL